MVSRCFHLCFHNETVLNPQFLAPHLCTLAKVLGFIRGPGSSYLSCLSAALLDPRGSAFTLCVQLLRCLHNINCAFHVQYMPVKQQLANVSILPCPEPTCLQQHMGTSVPFGPHLQPLPLWPQCSRLIRFTQTGCLISLLPLAPWKAIFEERVASQLTVLSENHVGTRVKWPSSKWQVWISLVPAASALHRIRYT